MRVRSHSPPRARENEGAVHGICAPGARRIEPRGVLGKPLTGELWRRTVLAGPSGPHGSMNQRQAIAFIRKHGVVLEASRGPVPSLAEAIVDEPLRGGWWSHPKGREIFALTRKVRDSEQVLVCRLVQGKITLVHRRLWPALVRAAERFPAEQLSRVREVHTRSGQHELQVVPFADWVPASTRATARRLSESAALTALGSWAKPSKARPKVSKKKTSKKRRR